MERRSDDSRDQGAEEALCMGPRGDCSRQLLPCERLSFHLELAFSGPTSPSVLMLSIVSSFVQHHLHRL